MNMDKEINELLDKIIEQQDSINGFLGDKDSGPDDLAVILQQIMDEQERIFNLRKLVEDPTTPNIDP